MCAPGSAGGCGACWTWRLALLLTALLFWGVLAGFKALQALGWGVDAADMARRFRDDPHAPEVNWILWMALTNLLPTLLHLCLACAGLWSGWLMRDEVFAAALRASASAAPMTGLVATTGAALPALAATPKPFTLAAPLLPAQAQKLMNWVYIDF